MCYHSGPERTWERWQLRGTPHSPKLQHCWNLTIRLFRVISGHSVGESYPSAEKQSVYSTASANWATQRKKEIILPQGHHPSLRFCHRSTRIYNQFLGGIYSTTPSRMGYDIRSIFKRGIANLISKFSSQ